MQHHRQTVIAHLPISLLLVGLLICGVVRADNYSEGMQAYMQDNYELAKVLWLKAAEEKNPKSMFNLGFLHEQQLVEGADYSKAESWYRMAGKHGYPAADYHLAQLLIANKTDNQRSAELLRRSAEKGYPPAQRKLAQSSTVGQGAQRAPAVDVVEGGAPAAVDKNYLDHRWIASRNKNDWTIQVLAFEDLAKVQGFIDQYQLSGKAAYFSERSGEGVLYKLIYGTFADKAQAEAARENLPAQLTRHGPWLRTIASVQKVIADR